MRASQRPSTIRIVPRNASVIEEPYDEMAILDKLPKLQKLDNFIALYMQLKEVELTGAALLATEDQTMKLDNKQFDCKRTQQSYSDLSV